MDRNAVLAVKILFIFSGLYSKESAEHVQQLLQKNEVPPTLFELYVEEIFSYLRGNIFKRFIESDKFTRNDIYQLSISIFKFRRKTSKTENVTANLNKLN